ncbi:cobalamin biosynthesis protein [Pseudonocardia benzenivorans]|uniref:Cobalamin biosynthesis protein CobD n=1 Tax=Pseudonocardia dioxanivorans (strain ATCC 55486 / DSM 44775 / JCM 13855 / CB1190) TaxID=675635 RepID=F4CJG9_PSEUX|nr:Cobalamin biosynthesis protein cbiB [Pseudonocardia dioxanivorans CB1190]GJF01788.1 cobalamin biosynthesis protein CobD [Pseudonocardia sp. D17]
MLRSVAAVRSSRGTARALGLLAGVLADRVVGDPRRGHPVAGFGRLAGALERRDRADSRARGAAHVVALVGGVVAAGLAVERASRAPAAVVVTTGVATWAVLGGRSLVGEGTALGRELAAGDEAAARRRLPHLCGRDPDTLDAAGMARAGVESLAENTSDAVVAPLLWGAVAGVPGLLGYRAVNTLDAMIGHRSPRYARFGWAAARLDDLANLVPARVAACLVAGLAPLVGGSPRAALRAWRRDAGAHPSPNAGPVEAAAAGALGVRLGGTTVYPYGVQERPVLGEGRPPEVPDLARAAVLSTAVGAASAVLAAATAMWTSRPGPCSRAR